MDKSLKKRIPPPGGGWDAFILFWTAVVAAELGIRTYLWRTLKL